MSQVVVTAMLTVKPEREKEFKDLLSPLVKATRAEQGCISYTAHCTAEAGRYCILETWDSQEDLDVHTASAHLTEFRDKAQDLLLDADVVLWQAIEPD